MGIKNKSKLLISVVLLFVFCLGSITVLSQGRNLSRLLPTKEAGQDKSPALAEENSAVMSIQTDAVNKMGFADFLTIYHSYSQTKIEDERLKEEGRGFQEKIDADRNKVVELEKKMNSGILSEKEKENLSKEVEELKTQITRNIQEFNLKIDSERRQAIDKLIEDLSVKISNYGKEKGYVMIFDKNGLIFSDTRFDITQEIIDYINKNNNE